MKNEKVINSGRLSKAHHQKVKETLEAVQKEVSKIVVGQEAVVRGVLRGILCDGHVLVEGVPGVAKTLIIRAIAEVTGCQMNRVQFTVDLLPTDITGIQSYTPKKGFEVMKGPIFSNFIIADEINRSPPKTQSALLEAMQEKKVTNAKKSYDLPKPFFVVATENPLENSGVYNLPEAQIDRFMFKLLIDYPKKEEEQLVLDQNMTTQSFESYDLKPILSAEKIIELQKLVKKVFASDAIKKYIVNLVGVTRRKDFQMSEYISYGASPRASIALYIDSKAEALMNGKDFVLPEDVRKVSLPVLRHRIILNYKAESEGVTADDIINKIIKSVNVP